jgi:hypothetical protein
MRTIIFVQSALLIILLGGCASLTEKFAVSFDPPKADSYWVERNPPTEPLNAAEALAVKSASELMTLQLPGETAHYESQNDSFTLIRHEQPAIGEESYVITVKYRIRDGLVYGETVPAYVALLDPQKEKFAQEVANNAASGNAPSIPEIYNGRMFIVKNKGINSCTVDVVEKDLDREYATYRVKTC